METKIIKLVTVRREELLQRLGISPEKVKWIHYNFTTNALELEISEEEGANG